MKEKKGIIDLCNIVSSGDLCNHTGLRQLPPNAAETTLLTFICCNEFDN